MFELLKTLVPSGVLKAWVMATARHVATASAAALGTYLLAHQASQGDVTNIQEGIVTVVLGLTSYGFSLWDVKNVDSKIKVAEAKIPAVPPLSETHYSEFNDIPKSYENVN